VAIRSVPVSLRIPAIGVSSSLSSLGLNADKTVQVPTKFAEPGWYKLGPTPGQIGSAVILGHVDDKQGPAVFFKLRSLKAGDKVDVSLTNGAIAHFAVKSVSTYTKAQFPAAKVYASQGYAALQLVTCGGKFDKAIGHYESNVVAYIILLSITAAKK
jgi:sortase (surface protein transpeptidase)